MPRRGILLAASVLVAAIGTALIAMYVSGANARARASYSPVTVWMAPKMDFPAGTTIADVASCACLSQVKVDPAAASNALNPFADRESKLRALSAIPRGTILRTVEFGAEAEGPSTVSTVVLPLMADDAPAGLKRGDRVDVLAQSEDKPLIAQDVVLTGDARYDSTSQVHLELAVTQDQAAAILSAVGRNRITIALLPPSSS